MKLTDFLKHGIKLNSDNIHYLTEHSTTYSNIENAVSKIMNCHVIAIQGKTRKRTIVEARQVCQALSKKYNLGSLREIGQRFGRRNHSSVLHSVKTVNDLIETNKEFKRKVELIESLL